METIQYKLEQFEGPLDLLLSLITKNKLNIDDIPIAVLCDQYMAYINHSMEHQVELASEFLVMASELMLIKSRMLLPRTNEAEEDPRKALVDTVLEYQKAKLGAEELRILFAEYGDRMVKEQDDLSPDRTYVAPHAVELLASALSHVLTEAKVTSETAKNSFEQIVRAPRIPLKTVVTELIATLRKKSAVYLDDYFRASADYPEMVAKFLAILELLKSHIIALDVTDEREDGVTNVSTHLPLTLHPEADEQKFESLALSEDGAEAAEPQKDKNLW